MALELVNDQEPVGSEYYSLYLMILSYWFPPEDGYAVSPHWTIPDARKVGDSNITSVVELRRHPLLLVPYFRFPLEVGAGGGHPSNH